MSLCDHDDIMPSPCYYDHHIINDDLLYYPCLMLSCYTLGYRKMTLISPGLIQLCKGFWMASKICFDKEALFQLIWCKCL